MFVRVVETRGRIPRGFTLIELLVVIAIIAILAAILFPVFSKVREKAYQSQCMNHQRQLAIGLLSFSQDNSETFPLPSEWVTATGLSSDSKVFDCPSSGHDGRPSDPDYGMNAFLFDTDPQSGEVVGAAVGNIEDPAKVELTADLKAATGAGSDDPDPQRAALIDQFTNPFPKTFTVRGYRGPGGNVAPRHNNSVIVTFADGHVKLLSGLEYGTGTNGYSIPLGGWRCYVDFSACKDAADAYRRLHSYFGESPMGTPIPGSFDAGSKAWTVPAGATLMTNSAVAAYSTPRDTNCFGTTGYEREAFMLDCSVTDGTLFSWGGYSDSNFAYPPATNVDFANETYDRIVTVNTTNNWIQFGQFYTYSTADADGSGPYVAGTWTALQTGMKGSRQTIADNASKFLIQSASNYDGPYAKFPTNAGADGFTLRGNPLGSVDTVIRASAAVTVSMPGAAPGMLAYTGPWVSFANQPKTGRYLKVSGGTMKIYKIFFSSGT